MSGFIEQIVPERCMSRITVTVSRRDSLYLVLKVGPTESHRLGCLFVYGDCASRWGGWFLCLVQIVGVAPWSGCRRSWGQSKMWTHWFQRLDDWCSGLCNPWLTSDVLMWPQSAAASPSSGLTWTRLLLHKLVNCNGWCGCWLQKLYDRCPCLTGGMSMWHRSAGASPSRAVARRIGWWRCLLLGDAGVWCLV